MQVKHKNIVTIRDICFNEYYPHIIMEFCNHGSLDTFIAEEKKVKSKKQLYSFNLAQQNIKILSNAAKWSIIYQIAQAINTLHQANIIHGNIKPSNILLYKD